MPTLDDIANSDSSQQPIPEIPTQEIPIEAPQSSGRMQEIISKFMTAETGAGAIFDYLDHPLNFAKSKGLARILRGFTGIFGSLSLAVIDIALGTLEFSKERKQGVVNNDVSSGGGIPS
jgi:hypothetical protein